MSQKATRLGLTLPKPIYEALLEWAEMESRPPTNLANLLIENSVRAKFPDRFPPKIKIES